MKARVRATGVLIDVIPKVNINAQHIRIFALPHKT